MKRESSSKSILLGRRESFGKDMISDIERTLYDLLVGISIPPFQRERLYSVLSDLQHYADGELKESSSQLMAKIRRERCSDASGFYLKYAPKKKHHAKSIDFSREVCFGNVCEGMILYQWCKLFIGGDGVAKLYDKKTKKCSIGGYFTDSIISLQSLGAFPLYDLYEDTEYVGTAQQVLCRFAIPPRFQAPCLISYAKSGCDTWNILHYHDGTQFDNSYEGYSLWTSGGNRQFFIPLNETQRYELAKVAEFV